MALKDLTTDLKSLRFGKDRIGGGSSREPFNTNSINGTPGDTGGPDFLLRANTLQRTGEDLSRIGQFMISPKGLQFAAKQNIYKIDGLRKLVGPASRKLPAYKVFIQALKKAGIDFTPSTGEGVAAKFENVNDETIKKF